MLIHNREKILTALNAELKRKKHGLATGYINKFCQNAIEDLDETLKSKEGRDNLEHLTGLKTIRIVNIVFSSQNKKGQSDNSIAMITILIFFIAVFAFVYLAYVK